MKRHAGLQTGYWQDCTTTDFARVDPRETVAVLPVAAVEQHGPHLPLSTDAVINDGLVRATLAQLPPAPPVLVLPPIAVGNSPEHASYPGTLAIEDTTLADAWTQVGRSVARAGVRKLVILNTHGGQKSLVDLVAVRLRAELGMLVVRATYFAFGVPPGVFAADEAAHDIHGGEVETSLMLHLAPQLVRMDTAADFRGLSHELAARKGGLGVEKPVGIGWLAEDLHPLGVCGNAARASAANGAKHLDHLAGRLAALLAEVATVQLPNARA